jgi:hypothetical protein
MLYDELIGTCINDIVEMDLTYEIQKGTLQDGNGEANLDDDLKISYSTVEYISNNVNDQQYLVRLTNFLVNFLPASYETWLLKWVPKLCQVLIKKATTTPRIPKLYVLLQTVLQISSKYKYFDPVQN